MEHFSRQTLDLAALRNDPIEANKTTSEFGLKHQLTSLKNDVIIIYDLRVPKTVNLSNLGISADFDFSRKLCHPNED